MVLAHVSFRYQGVDWTRSFEVEEGASVLQLKEAMLRPGGGGAADMECFELRQQGQRVGDFEKVGPDSCFDFMYLGQEEGAQRAARDAEIKASYDRAARAEEERKQKQEEERRRKEAARLEQLRREAEEQARREAAKAPRAPKNVDVKVKHAVEELRSEVTVSVPSTATILDLRLAVMAALGESKLSEIKLIKKQGSAFTALGNEAAIGAQREFLAMGRVLRVESSACDLDFRVTCIQDYSEISVSVSSERTVKELRAKICEVVRRGPASSVKLWCGERELRDSEALGVVAEQSDCCVVLSGISLSEPVAVNITLTHVTSGRTLSLAIEDTSSLRELRAAASSVAPGELRLVRRLTGGHWQALPDSDRLNGRREFSCMGSALDVVVEEVELTVSICLDSEMGICQDMAIKKNSTVRALKQMLADTDPTKRTRPEDFGLALMSSKAPLSDATPITEELLSLQLLPKEEKPCLSGRWTVRNVDTGETVSFVLQHAEGAESFSGWQEDEHGTPVTKGCISSADRGLSFQIGDNVAVTGRLTEDGASMTEMSVHWMDSGVPLGAFEGSYVGPP